MTGLQDFLFDTEACRDAGFFCFAIRRNHEYKLDKNFIPHCASVGQKKILS